MENDRDSKLKFEIIGQLIVVFFFFVAILHRLQLTEVTRQQIEQELNIVNKEKAEIIEQFQQVNERISRDENDCILDSFFFLDR